MVKKTKKARKKSKNTSEEVSDNGQDKDTPVLRINGLYRKFGSFTAVNDLSFQINKGEFMGLMGPNGAGKSTTLKCMTGLLRPTSGKIYIQGTDITKDPKGALAHTGCVVETPAYHNMITPAELLMYTGRIYGLNNYEINLRSRDVLEQMRMWDWRDKKIAGFSKGMRQRVALAQALLPNPDFLVLDEPTSGLDPRGMVEMREILKELKDGTRSILISTHILSEVEDLCDYVTMINHGTIVASGQVEGLVDRMVAGREQKLHVRTLTPIPDGFRSMIMGEPGVQDAEFADPTHMTIVFKGDYEKKADVYEFLFQNKLRVIGFSEEGGGLEDLYMELTDEEGVNIK